MRTADSQILQQFDRIRRDTPDRPLIHLPLAKSTLTATQIWNAGLHQRDLLQAADVGPHQLVIYGAGNKPELFGLWLACRFLGALLMPIDAGTTIREFVTFAERFGASALILPASSAVTAFGDPSPYVPGLVRVTPKRRLLGPQPYEGAAVLKLTSGSTGLPKATFTTEQQLVDDTNHIVTAMDIGPDDCQMAVIPLSHAYGIGNLLVPLLVQGTAIVLRETFVPHQFATDAAAYRAGVFPGVPYMFDHFKNHISPGAWPPRLDRLISAGARLDLSTVRGFHSSFGVKIRSFYGTSETGGIAFDDSADFVEDGSVGRPMPGVTITLRPDDDGPRDGGRVHVRGSAVASGYVGEHPTDDGFTTDGFLTGDYGRFTDRGHLVLTGRVSSFINVAGRKVQPQEVEEVLREMPGVVDARVLGVPDPVRGEQIVACIAVADRDPGVVEIRQFCAARLAPHKIPRRIIKVDRIPLTERGKTDRRSLQELVQQRLRESPEAGVL